MGFFCPPPPPHPILNSVKVTTLQSCKCIEKRLAVAFLCIFRIFWEHLSWKTSANGCFWLFFYYSNLLYVIFNKTVTKLVTSLRKCFFPYLEYHKLPYDLFFISKSSTNRYIWKQILVGKAYWTLGFIFCMNWFLYP